MNFYGHSDSCCNFLWQSQVGVGPGPISVLMMACCMVAASVLHRAGQRDLLLSICYFF